MPLVRSPGWLVGSAIAVAATSVRAEPTLEVTESGACPSRAELVDALEARHLAAGSSGWKLGLRARPGAAVLRLENVAGDVVLERELQSVDCPAMAAAFALIVEAYFVEIGMIAQPGSGATAPATPSPEAQLPRPASGPAAVSAAPAQAAPTRASRAARPEVFAAVGPELLLPSPVVTMVAAAGFGLDWSRLAARLELLTTLPHKVRARTRDRVSRWANRAALEVGSNLAGLEPWAGAGVTAVWLEADELKVHRARTFWSPVVGAGVAVPQRLGSNWAGRVDLGCHLPVFEERYSISGVDIGPGPLFGCDLTYGIVWSAGSGTP